MFHAINAWLARQARRACDARLARGDVIAAASGWQVQRLAGSTYRYRDPRFGALQARHVHTFDGLTYYCPARDCWVNRNQPGAGTAAGSWYRP